MEKIQGSQAKGGRFQKLVLGAVAATVLLNASGAECAEKAKSSVAGPLALYSIGAFADAYSTEMALRNPGVREANPLLQSRNTRFGIKAAEIATLTLIDHAIARKHKGTAKAMRIVVFASRIALAAHNLSNANKAR